jgi:hypothetical protein
MVMAVTRKFVAGDVMEVWVLFKVCDGRCDGNMATLRVCCGRCGGSMATLGAFGIKGNGGEATC